MLNTLRDDLDVKINEPTAKYLFYIITGSDHREKFVTNAAIPINPTQNMLISSKAKEDNPAK